MLTIDEEDDECDYLTDVFERQRKSGVDDDHEPDELNTPKDESQKEEPRKGTEKPSSAKSDTTSERPRKVSYDLVNKQGSDEGDQLLRIVKSSPALKKGSPTRKRSVGSATSAIRAVRKLSYAISSALVVRPYSVTKSTKNSRKPPIADFYEEMTKVESLNPLRTLHNSVPLKEMDGFFDKTAGEGAETLVTPINTPSRKPPSRRLAARSAPNPVQSAEKKSSAGSEPDTEGVTDLLTEAIQKLDS